MPLPTAPAKPVAPPVGGSLSPHLFVQEFLCSRDHPELVAANTVAWCADESVRANAQRLALEVFEPARLLLGALHVNSGFRCPALNAAVGGSGSKPGQRPSAHMQGRAIDVTPLQLGLADSMEKLLRSSVPYEKVILECHGGHWLHLQVGQPGEPARRIALMWFGGDYLPFNAADPRVEALT